MLTESIFNTASAPPSCAIENRLQKAYTLPAKKGQQLFLLRLASSLLHSYPRSSVAAILVMTSGYVVALFFVWLEAEDKAPLRTVGSICLAMSAMLVGGGVVLSLRRVTRRGKGQLWQLENEVLQLTNTTFDPPQRWNCALLVASISMVAIGVERFVAGCVGHGEMSDPRLQIRVGHDWLTTPQRVFAIISGLVNIFAIPMVFTWYLALKQASLHVTTIISYIHKSVIAGSPLAQDWDHEVVPTLRLAMQTILPTLSAGFGDGIIAVWSAFWMISLGCFAQYLQDGAPLFLVYMCMAATFPLFLALDVARASTACNQILAALNNKRISQMDPTIHNKILMLETALLHLNSRQVRHCQGVLLKLIRTVRCLPSPAMASFSYMHACTRYVDCMR
jgi:hypothetical protein